MSLSRVLNIITKEIPIYYLTRIVSILPNHGITCRLRGLVVSPFWGKVGKNFKLAQGGIYNYPEKISIGDNVYIAHRAYINASSGLLIEDNVTIGPNCIIATTNHDVMDGKVVDYGYGAQVRIQSGTWVAGNVTITAGVDIGRNCVVAAGSVVTKSFPDGCMIAGVPAKVIKNLTTKNEEIL